MDSTKRPPTLSLRLDTPVLESLRDLASREGVSMNTLVVGLIVKAATGDGGSSFQAPGKADLAEKIALDALADDPSAIGAVIGCGRWLHLRGLPRTAALVWSRGVALIEADPDPVRGGSAAASDELVRIAREMHKSREHALAVSFVRQALQRNPRNRRASNLAGQWLVRRGQHESARGDLVAARASFDEAEELLRDVKQFDNHALLHAGWAALELADLDNDRTMGGLALKDISDAMKRWAFGTRDPDERGSWMTHIERLRSKGENHLADELVEFANANAEWGTISGSEQRGSTDDTEL